MKRFVPFFLLIVVITLLLAAGCSTTPSPATTPAATGAPTGGTAVSTPPPVIRTSQPSSGRVILDERVPLMSGYPDTFQKYAFADYGYQYLYPGDTFSIAINSDKPVNILVIDKGDEMKFPQAIPEWNTVLRKDQWDYSPVVPVFSQSNILRKEMTFTIKEKASYFLIIDPRFSSEQTWGGSKHEEVHVDVKVTKI